MQLWWRFTLMGGTQLSRVTVTSFRYRFRQGAWRQAVLVDGIELI
jgi:hypothetical protein